MRVRKRRSGSRGEGGEEGEECCFSLMKVPLQSDDLNTIFTCLLLWKDQLRGILLWQCSQTPSMLGALLSHWWLMWCLHVFPLSSSSADGQLCVVMLSGLIPAQQAHIVSCQMFTKLLPLSQTAVQSAIHIILSPCWHPTILSLSNNSRKQLRICVTEVDCG